MAPRRRNASISLGARGVSSASRAVSAPMAKRKRKASTSLGASSGSQASRAATAPMAPRKRKVATGQSSRRSKQQHSDDDHRYGYFTPPPPEDVSHGSNQGSDSEDTDSDDDELKIISEAEFKNAKKYTFSAGKDTTGENEQDATTTHSEKLAVAFGSLNTLGHADIRNVKSMSMCRECHGFMKHVVDVDVENYSGSG